MICPNCSHKENYDFYICPRCHYEIDVDLNNDSLDFDDELASMLNQETLDLTNEVTAISSDNIIDEILDDIITNTKATDKVFELKGLSRKMIGRDREFNILTEYYNKIKKKKLSSSITIVGENGLGKSHIITTFLKSIKDENFYLIEVESLNNDKDQDYSIFRNILQRLILVQEKDLEEIKTEKLKKFLKQNTPFHIYGELKAVFSRLLGLKTEKYIKDMDIMSYDRILKRSFRQVFTTVIENNQFLVIAIKHLENADLRSLEIINYFISLPSYKNLMFLSTALPSENIKPFLKGGVAKRYYINLTPLSDKDSQIMVSTILKGITLDKTTVGFIVDSTMGNPLFIEESLTYLIDKKIIKEKDGRFISLDKKRLKEIKIPMTFEEAVYSKLKRLPKLQFMILQLASISGKTFHRRVIKVLINVDLEIIKDKKRDKYWKVESLKDKINLSMDQLIKVGILSAHYNSNYDDLDYRFNNDTEYKIFYNSIKKETLKTYHSYLAQYFESRIDNKKIRNNELISYQYKKAGNNYQASKYFFIAGKEAEKRYDNFRAIRLYGEAINALDNKNILSRIEVLHNIGSLYDTIGKPQDAIKSFLEMGNLAGVILFENKMGAAFNKAGRIHRDLGEFDKSLYYLKKAYEYFKNSKDKRGIASTLDDIGNVYWRKRRFQEALQHYMNSLKIRKSIDDQKSIALSLNNIGLLYYSQGFIVEAEEYLYEAYKLRTDISDKYGEMVSLNSLAVLTFGKGDDIEAKGLWLKALTIAEEIGNVNFQAITMVNLGELYIEGEQLTKAANYLKGAQELALESSNKRILAHIYLGLGILELKKSDIDIASEFLNKALELSEELNDNEIMGRVYCKLGEIESTTLFGNDSTDLITLAEDHFLRSLTLLRKVSEPLMAETYVSYSEYLLSKGKRGKAKKYISKAEKIYTNYDMQLKLSQVKRFKKELL